MENYIEKLELILANNEIENEDLIAEFVKAAKTDKDKENAIKTLFDKSESENPFENLTYFDLVNFYEEIQESK